MPSPESKKNSNKKIQASEQPAIPPDGEDINTTDTQSQPKTRIVSGNLKAFRIHTQEKKLIPATPADLKSELRATIAQLNKLHTLCSRIRIESPPSQEIDLLARTLFNALEQGKQDSLDHMAIKPEGDLRFGDYERWSDRRNKSEKPLEFLRRVWGKYIDAGLLFQIDLRGQQATKNIHNPSKGLDRTLHAELSKQCRLEGKDLTDYIPTYKNRRSGKK
jgi:hypothetical protein